MKDTATSTRELMELLMDQPGRSALIGLMVSGEDIDHQNLCIDRYWVLTFKLKSHLKGRCGYTVMLVMCFECLKYQ